MNLNDETVLSLGLMSFVIGIFVGHFTYFEYSGLSISAFIEGVLFGLSFVMNLFYLETRSKLSTKN